MNVTRTDFIRQTLSNADMTRAMVEHHVYAQGWRSEVDWGAVGEMFAITHGGCVCFRDCEHTDTPSWVEASGLDPETFNLGFSLFFGATPQIHDYIQRDPGLSIERVWDIWTLEFERIAMNPSPEIILEALTQVCSAFTHRMLSA